MRVVLQRVSKAAVHIDGIEKGVIKTGFLILLGIEGADTQDDIKWLTKKISQLRVFNDEDGKMNRSIQDIDGELLVISQFTLHANNKKGTRPSFIRAARPAQAIPLYESFVKALQPHIKKPIQTGEFGADMQVSLTNDGPVTIILDSQQKDI